ncbi:MAG: threonylcarbamoyl-AMP synthase [Desulfobacterales bacterium RIFOXYA12_FULL_46_15]|nr:MAG: threonylcarbamoyl-AMP synthase [Desulfobacterales bacterium RIFOXYA12_FULL_46_15]
MYDPDKIIRLDPVRPDSYYIARAGNIIRNNGAVIFPTRCLYGIGARALDEKAVKNVFWIKQRPLNNPILVLIPDQSHLEKLVKSIPEPAKILMKIFWPGSLTLVFDAKNEIPNLLTAGSGKLGIRIPSHPVAKALVNHLGFPVTGTSANLSGRPGCHRIDLLDPSIIETSDLVLDAGILKGGAGSTIVDVTVFPIRMIREGEISQEELQKALVH